MNVAGPYLFQTVQVYNPKNYMNWLLAIQTRSTDGPTFGLGALMAPPADPMEKKRLCIFGQNGPLASILEIFGPKTLFAK